jgi:2-keto-4-pentenoate hydratase/2-oxohepta-3-ene-1,7-dioic acid hydratase in catechol pathway
LRLYRYTSGAASPRIAVAHGETPIDLQDAWTHLNGRPAQAEQDFLSSTAALIERGPQAWAEVGDAARAASDVREFEVSEERGARWLRPLDRLASLRDFLSFESHVKAAAERRRTEVPDYWYEAPVYYKGNHRSIIGPGEDCPWPSYTENLDFELELGMIVGVGGRDIEKDDAAKHIFGFTIMNDFSARDIQSREMTAWLGPAKGKDFATALGPCIMTADEVGAHPDLEMVCRVNGVEWGRARSGEMHWSWADMIAHVSRDEDVYPCDVYGSGTPGGCCGVDLDRRLSAGDVVELAIDGIGVLRNRLGGS